MFVAVVREVSLRITPSIVTPDAEVVSLIVLVVITSPDVTTKLETQT